MLHSKTDNMHRRGDTTIAVVGASRQDATAVPRVQCVLPHAGHIHCLCFWDVSGKASYRGMWENYLNWSDGLIFMMEAGKENYSTSIEILSIKGV